MTIPKGFNEWENLQDLVRKDHNRDVREYFKNQNDNDISTPKSRLKHTCLIKDEDTAAMTQLRMWLFEITVGRAQSIQRPVYGIPVQELQRITKFKPQIKLFFKEEGISKRARDAISNTGLAFTDLNLTEPSGGKTAQRIFGFQPAKAIVNISQAGTTNSTSKITGRPYKKRNSDSYTFPFGREKETTTYAEAKAAILAKVVTGDNNRGVSFDSEVYR